MPNKLIKELEDFLMPYVQDRFDLSGSALGGIASQFLNYGERIQAIVTWHVKSFVRCILQVEGSIVLRDIAAVVMAETYTMLKMTPVRNMFRSGTEEGDIADSRVIIENEIHNWLIYLQKHGKLPGTYNRFLGRYKSAF
jgi:hypothetical protein